MEQHVVQRGERSRELRRLFPGFLRKIMVREDPRVDEAQHVFGALGEQAADIHVAVHADDRHAVLIASAQRKLIGFALAGDLPADVRFRDAHEPLDEADDRLQ